MNPETENIETSPHLAEPKIINSLLLISYYCRSYTLAILTATPLQ